MLEIRFITTQIPLPPSPTPLVQFIEAFLAEWGEPLRWAITQVDSNRQVLEIEAVVTRSGDG